MGMCVALFWGGTFIAGRIIITALPPMAAATGRFAVALLLLLGLTFKLEGGLPRLTGRQLFSTFLLGLTGIFAYNIFFFTALHTLPAGRTALFVALSPIITALLLALFCGERLGRKWWGIAIAFAGAVIVITHGDIGAAIHDISRTIGRGELCIMAAVTCWSAYTIIGRGLLQQLSPLVATSYASLWGLAMLFLGTLTEWKDIHFSQINSSVIVAIVYHGALGTVAGFVWYYEGVKALGPSRAAVFNNLVPVFGVSLATLVLGETVTASMLLGGAIVLLGVLLTNSARFSLFTWSGWKRGAASSSPSPATTRKE